MVRRQRATPAPIESGKEDREEYDALDKGCQNDGDGQDIACSTGIAAGGFSGFHAEKTDADAGTESCESNVKFAFNSCHDHGEVCDERVHYVVGLVVFVVVATPAPAVMPRSSRRKC